MRAVAVFGDDLGDLPAFDAVAELAAQGVAVARIAVVDAESATEVAAQADLVVEGPAGAVALLEQLVRRPQSAAERVRRGGELVVQPVRGGAPQHQGPQAGPARARRSAGSIESARWRVSAVPATSKGLTPNAASDSSSQAPASRERTSTPSAPLSSEPSLATRLRPSRTGLTSRTSEMVSAASERGRSSSTCRTMGVHVGGAPGVVDPLRRVRHLGPVGEIVGQPLPRRVHQRDVHHLVPPLRVGDQELLEGQHAPHDVLRRLDAVDPQDDAAPPGLGPQGLDRPGALGAGRLGEEALVIRGERGDEGRGRRRRSRPARPGPGRRSRPGTRPPTGGRGTRRPRIRPGRPGAPRRRPIGQDAQHVGVGEGDVAEVHGAQVGPGPASIRPGGRSGSPAPGPSTLPGPGRSRCRRRTWLYRR
jgi:hypothetical protein